MSKKKSDLFASVTFPEAGQEMTAVQKAKQLQVHPETVIRYAAQLGGRRVGRFWRFPWNHPEQVALETSPVPALVPPRAISYRTVRQSSDSRDAIRRINQILGVPSRGSRR